VLRHVPWEHLGAFEAHLAAAGVGRTYVDLFAGAAVPDLTRSRAVFAMGGPMGVYDTDRYPFLRAEVAALRAAATAGVPVVGVCLGSQLLAAALGADVRPNPRGKEIGWGQVRTTADAAADAILGRFAPVETVLHWHGDVFDLPEGAVSLASSTLTPHQAYRWGARAWGLLFHVEADPALVAGWLDEPTMRAEAAAVDPDLPERIRAAAAEHRDRLALLQKAVIEAALSPTLSPG
jgi:GMP synthase (glutamine-hydrolysing)